MRKWALVVIAAGLTLALAGIAIASTQFKQVSNITLTAKKAGQSSGIKADVHSTDPGAPGQKPKAAKSLKVTFPAGTKFNFGKVHPCTLSDSKLSQPGGPTCPSSSKIGTGSAIANASPIPGASKISATVTAYVHSGKDVILRVVTNKNVAPPVVIHQTVSGNTFTIPVPQQKVGNVAVVLTSLKLNIPASGSGSGALITAGKCVSKQFVVKTHFTYVDRSALDITSTSPCS